MHSKHLALSAYLCCCFPLYISVLYLPQKHKWEAHSRAACLHNVLILNVCLTPSGGMNCLYSVCCYVSCRPTGGCCVCLVDCWWISAPQQQEGGAPLLLIWPGCRGQRNSTSGRKRYAFPLSVHKGPNGKTSVCFKWSRLSHFQQQNELYVWIWKQNVVTTVFRFLVWTCVDRRASTLPRTRPTSASRWSDSERFWSHAPSILAGFPILLEHLVWSMLRP